MLSDVQYNTIMSDVIKKYGSLDRPNHSFVRHAKEHVYYKELLKEVSILFKVENVTDENVDVSFQFILEKRGFKWNLQLSMVGLYAVFLRLNKSPPAIELVSFNSYSSEELEIINTLKRYQVLLLDEDILTRRVDMKLYATEIENVRIYQALFGDYDILPWQR